MVQEGKSGVAQYVIQLTRRLARKAEIDIIVAGVKADRSLFPFLADNQWENIPASCRNGLLSFLWHQFAIPRLCIKHNIQLLHIPSYRRMVYSTATPQVATIHDCAPFRMQNKYDRMRTFFGTRIVPILARRMHKIIAVSSTTAADVRNFMKVPSQNIITVFNGIDHDRFHCPRAEMLPLFLEKREQKAPYFIFVARLEHPGKNHVRLIEAFNRFKATTGSPAQLVLAGAPWNGIEVIQAAIATSPYTTDIRYLGFVHDEELPFWYAGSIGLLFPSLVEGFGFAVVEAQACGTLVASSNQTSLTEVAGPATLLFDPFKEDEMVTAMSEMATMCPARRQELLAQSLDWAAQFTWDKAADQCLAVYHALLYPDQHPLKISPNQKEAPAIPASLGQ